MVIVLLGDFNACVDDKALQTFCKSYSFNSLIKQPTYFKNPENPTCIDLRDYTHMTSMKIVQFSKPPTTLVHLRQKLFDSLDLGRPISNEHPPTPNDN